MNELFKAGGGFLLYSAYFARMQSVGKFKKNIQPFAAKLQLINSSSLLISEYSKRYLDHLLAHSYYYLEIYAHVLDKAAATSGKNCDELTMVDYGAGNGLLGMFAKFCGFKKVFICDMDADFIHAAKLLCVELNILIDEFVTGDVDILAAFVTTEKIDVVAGTDVIEHIYNLDDFFAGIKKINPQMITVFTTASNPNNFIKLNQIKKLQVKDELEGSDPKDFLLAGAEKHESFLSIRKKIIVGNFPQVNETDLVLLSKNTRGLNEADIIEATENFLKTGQMPMPALHSTNTCNPITGSWTERILTVNEYKNIYSNYGFFLNIENGFYNATTGGLKKYVNGLLNKSVKVLGRSLAPFITLTGYPGN